MTVEKISKADVREMVSELDNVRKAIGEVIIGQESVVSEMLAGLLAGGHCLIEGVPGLGKTLLVKSLAQSLRLKFGRIQFTPDLMPSDIIGTEIIEEDHQTGKRSFKFNRGPIFANLILADEINRTPPKTQAALLEAMQERSVTYAGESYPLDPPFFVLATQNPLEQAGTYELPEAQLDRFLLQIKMDYPTLDEEYRVLLSTTGDREANITPIMDADLVIRLQKLTRQVSISSALLDYVNRLVRSTRPMNTAITAIKEWVKWGAGPRGGQSLILASKGRALLSGRLAVTREDIRTMVTPVLRHRILLNFHAQAEQTSISNVIETLVGEVPGPDDTIVT